MDVCQEMLLSNLDSHNSSTLDFKQLVAKVVCTLTPRETTVVTQTHTFHFHFPYSLG